MRPKVYIDGQAGTTGLRIRDWLAEREDLDIVVLPDARRKDPQARREAIAAADLAVLCLPDEAAREAVVWAVAAGTRVLDASTAHRVAADWIYGLPELCPEQRGLIRAAPRVSNPGCYPTAFVLLMRPLVDEGLLAPETPMTIHALSGYSGGGRKLIERWEDASTGLRALPWEVPYALDRVHKHVPEMRLYSGLAGAPFFVPAVGAFRCGMRVEVPLHAGLIGGVGARDLWDTLTARYRNEQFVRVRPLADEVPATETFLDPCACNDTNRIELSVVAHPSGHVLLVAILDNLGKGAAAAAVQNLNLMFGLREDTGLRV